LEANEGPRVLLGVGRGWVSFNGDLWGVSPVLADAEAVDRLVKALQANKALLPKKKSKNDERQLWRGAFRYWPTN
jgi:alkanesulfonate monooxygenase SsuD/methylene tetrahydromethanopterin reductase-like flavin-dependent oxidoreductase (luciferase family)